MSVLEDREKEEPSVPGGSPAWTWTRVRKSRNNRSRNHRLSLSSCWGFPLPSDRKSGLVSVLMGQGICVNPDMLSPKGQGETASSSDLGPVIVWEPELPDTEPENGSKSSEGKYQNR